MISIIIPIFNESENIQPLHGELSSVMATMNHDVEVIFVDDGSTDGSHRILDELAEGDRRVRVIHLRRNFGQTAAMMAGFDFSRGNVIVPMDGDLQNDPRDIPRLVSKIEEGYDVCSGWRRNRKDGFWKRRLTSRLANALISKVAKIKLHDIGCTLKAYRKECLHNVRLYGEMHRFIPAYASWQGASITEIQVNHRPRKKGVTSYGLERTFKVLLDLFVVAFMDRFFAKPIHLFGGIGLLNFLLSFVCVIVSIYFKFWGGKSFIETPLPLLAVMTFITGTLFLLMGLLAELLVRTYFESQEKRTYVVASTRNLEERPGDASTSSHQPA